MGQTVSSSYAIGDDWKALEPAGDIHVCDGAFQVLDNPVSFGVQEDAALELTVGTIFGVQGMNLRDIKAKNTTAGSNGRLVFFGVLCDGDA